MSFNHNKQLLTVDYRKKSIISFMQRRLFLWKQIRKCFEKKLLIIEFINKIN